MSLGARGDALGEQGGAFRRHRREQALPDLIVGDAARRESLGRAPLFDQRGDLGIDRALAVLIAIPAAPGFHAEPARFAQMVGDVDIARLRIAGRRLALAPGPGDLQPRKVEHGERPHREAVGFHGGVDLLRQRAVLQQELRLAPVGGEDAVADEAFGDAAHDRQLAQPLRDREAGRQHVRRGAGAAHDLEQAHHVGRREEMQPEHALRPRRRRGDRVGIEIAGVGREDRVRAHDAVQPDEQLGLDREIVEHGLDDEVGVAEDSNVAAGRSAGAADRPCPRRRCGRIAARDPAALRSGCGPWRPRLRSARCR